MTTFATLAALRKELAALDAYLRKEIKHLQTALGDILRDLYDIKARLPVRKAGKVGRRGVHRSSPKP
jgi:hypothetical protein